VMVCGRCGTPMVSSQLKDGAGQYVCRRRAAWPDGCGRMSVNRPKADAHVTGEVLDALDGAETAARARRPGPDVAALTSELEAAEASLIAASDDHYVHRTITAAQFQSVQAKLTGRIEELRRQIVEAEPPTKLRGDLRSAWKQMPSEAKRAVLVRVLDRVVCEPQDRKAPRRFDPSRLRIVWRA
jgi:hypothetical protein